MIKKINLPQKFQIKGYEGNKIFGNLYKSNQQNPKLIIIVHGIGGTKEDLHIKFLFDFYFKSGYDVISYDSTHSLGESEGEYFNATPTIYLENLKSVVDYAKNNNLGNQGIILIGHSIGGLISGYYGLENSKIEKIILLSSVISGDLFNESLGDEILKNRKEIGYYDSLIGLPDGSKPKLGYGFIKDLENYDLLKIAKNLEQEIIIIVGDKDNGVPIKYQKLFYESLGDIKKQFFVLEDTGHFVKKDHQFQQLEKILSLI